MKKLNNDGSALLIILLVIVLAGLAGAGYVIWKKSQSSTTVTTDSSQSAAADTDSSVDLTKKYTLTIPDGAKRNEAQEAKIESTRDSGSVYRYYELPGDDAMVVGIEIRPFTEKENGLAENASDYGLIASTAASARGKEIYPNGVSQQAANTSVVGASGSGYIIKRLKASDDDTLLTVQSAATKDKYIVTIELIGSNKNLSAYNKTGKNIFDSLKLN